MIITSPGLQELVDGNYIQNRNRAVVIDVASVCLHLGNMFTTYDPYNGEPFIPPKTMPSTTRSVAPEDFHILPPGGIVLSCTEEEVEIPKDKFGFIQTKGSIARGFISVHMSDGQVDPGYKGKITLELFNASAFYYKLAPGMQIASLFFMKTDAPVESYNGRYQNSGAPTTMKSRT
jgi:dCTP deaminase